MEGKNKMSTVSETPVVALVACPYHYKDYMTRSDVAIDDLGLGYLYTALTERGYPVELFDSIHMKVFFTPPYEQLGQKVLAAKPSYVGFSDPMFDFDKSLALSRMLKEKLPGLTVIYGDVHASLYPKEILLNESHVDFVVSGDGDRSLPILIDALEAGSDISGVPGLSFRRNGTIVSNPPDFDIDLDSLAYPYRPSLKDPDTNQTLFFNLISSRGCPGHCTYCSMSAFLTRHCGNGNNRWRRRSPKNVFDEMRYLYDRGVRKFHFSDDNWIGVREIGLERAVELCELIMAHQMDDIAFSASIRPDSLLPTDGEALSLMKRAGLCFLNFGLEASNEAQLRLYGKQYDLSLIKDVADLIFSHQIMIRVGYIMFCPYSTFDMVLQNARFLGQAGLGYMFPSFYSKLISLSDIPIEKRFQRDNLLLKPTTYKSQGIYKFQDERVEKFQTLIFDIMFPEHESTYDILAAGFKTAEYSSQIDGLFVSLRGSLSRIADASVDLFEFCAQTSEKTSEEDETLFNCNKYSLKWLKVLKTERKYLDTLTSGLPD